MDKQVISEKSSVYIILLMCYLASGFAFAQHSETSGAEFAVSRDNLPQKEPLYSPCVGQSHPDRVYWGDSRLHTSYSWDAGLVGNSLGPFRINELFRQHDIVIAFPQRDVHIDGSVLIDRREIEPGT